MHNNDSFEESEISSDVVEYFKELPSYIKHIE